MLGGSGQIRVGRSFRGKKVQKPKLLKIGHPKDLNCKFEVQGVLTQNIL